MLNNNSLKSERKLQQKPDKNKIEKVNDVKFITTYNRALPNINKIIKNNLSILYTDETMKKIFPPNTIDAKILRKFYHLLCFLKVKQIENSITSCNKCDTCKNFLVPDAKFKCKVTGRVYNIRGKLVTPLMLFI